MPTPDQQWMNYAPYTGGAGPTEHQREHNTRALVIDCPGSHTEIGPSEHDPSVIEAVACKGTRRVVFDRWGFVSLDSDALDQAPWDAALRYLNFGKRPKV